MKKLKLLLVLFTLFLVFMPSFAFASESISYQFVTSMMMICENYILMLFDEFAQWIKPLFYILATIVLVSFSVKMMFGKLEILALVKLLLSKI